jgi:diaminopimelate decarboxylase
MVENSKLHINEKDHLTVGGCDCVNLAKEFNTPLYVMDENVIRENMRLYKNAMDKYYEGKGLVLYASKALCTMALCKIAEQEGFGLDVVSGGEIYTAGKAGFPMEKVYFHGNNKTSKELSEALDYGVGRIVVDNIHELKLLNEICARKGKKAQISVRVKPGVDAHTHDFVKTGQIDSKFGVALENGEVFEFAALAGKLDNVELVGLHCHIGSQIFDLLPFTETAEVMLNLISDLKEKYGIEITELNLGGGYGIKYTEDDDPVEYDRYIESVSGTVKKLCSEKGIEQPFMLMEPGRSIVAPAGLTLYTVGAVKDIENIRKYVAIDGGMFDNPRYALYESKYTFVLANKASELKSQIVTVAGKCCESGDLIGKDVELPEAEPGDIMAVLATGAYNYSMSMNYNRNGRPPMILVKDGKARIIVKGEDYEDIIRNDVIPEDL